MHTLRVCVCLNALYTYNYTNENGFFFLTRGHNAGLITRKYENG